MNQERLRKTPNIAVVGSTSLLGKELQDMLETRDFPVGRLALLETEEYAGLLQEFAGEIQITQVISPETFDDIDIAFFTCSPGIMRAYVASGARFPELTIDLTQAGLDGTVYLEGISNPRSLKSRRKELPVPSGRNARVGGSAATGNRPFTISYAVPSPPTAMKRL